MNIELKNVQIEKIFEPKSGTSTAGKTWKSMDFLVKQDAEFNGKTYTKRCLINIFGEDKVHDFGVNFSVGDSLDVFCNVDSQEWKGNYYNKIQAWKWVSINTVPRSNVSTATATIPPAPAKVELPKEDLPF